MSRDEFLSTWKGAGAITLATMAGGYMLTTIMLLVIGFRDAWLHYALTTIFPLILAPAAAFPLLVMAHRLRAMKSDLEALLRLDPLTELPNRRAFFEQAERTFQSRGDATLMMIDIDHFKHVNDSYGHDIGDGVLRAVAQSIQHIVADTTGHGVTFAARIGGEEFAVLVEGLTGAAAERLAGDLVATIGNSPVQGGGQSIPVTVSVGLAHRRAGDSPGMVLRAADNACYRAKRLGRNQWRQVDMLDEMPAPMRTSVMTAA